MNDESASVDETAGHASGAEAAGIGGQPWEDDPRPTMLVVDDDRVYRTRLVRALRQRGYQVCEAQNPEEALAIAREESPEFALLDLRMPGGNGLDLVRDLLAIDAHTNIVLLTGYGSIATALDAVRRGATHYLTKPADVDEILGAFARKEDEAFVDSVPEGIEGTPSLARVEWEHIQRVLTDCEHNISEAARRLGIHRRSLQRKLAKFPVAR